MALISKQKITESGLNPALAAAAGGGDSWVNNGAQFLFIRNGGGGSINVTVAAQSNPDASLGWGALDKVDAVVAVPAGEDRMIGPFPSKAYNDGNGQAQITYSGVTSVTIGIIEL